MSDAVAAPPTPGDLALRYLAYWAEEYDMREIRARSAGAFDAAVCFQQRAEWIRTFQYVYRIQGTPAQTLLVLGSNDLLLVEGDDTDAWFLTSTGYQLLAMAEGGIE